MRVFTNTKVVTVVDGVFTEEEIQSMDAWFSKYLHWGLGSDNPKQGAAYTTLCRSLKWDQWIGLHALLGDVAQILKYRIERNTDIKVPFFHRCLINNFRVGDSPQFHQDSNDPKGKTFMVYPNMVWQLNWGGYTVFADKDGNVVDVSNPKPGRVVIFDSEVKHCGIAPAKGHQGPGRYSIAYQDPLGTYDSSLRTRCKPEDIEKTSFVSIYGDNYMRLRSEYTS